MRLLDGREVEVGTSAASLSSAHSAGTRHSLMVAPAPAPAPSPVVSVAQAPTSSQSTLHGMNNIIEGDVDSDTLLLDYEFVELANDPAATEQVPPSASLNERTDSVNINVRTDEDAFLDHFNDGADHDSKANDDPMQSLGIKHELEDLDLSSFHYLDHHIHHEHDCESVAASPGHSTKGPSTELLEKSEIVCFKDDLFDIDMMRSKDDTKKSAHQIMIPPNDRQLTPEAITVLTQWILSPQNIIHPYPTLEEKKELMIKADIGEKQLKRWLSRARWKILEPMLDKSTTNDGGNDTKKVEKCECGDRDNAKPQTAVNRKDNGNITTSIRRSKSEKGNLNIKPRNNSFITKLRIILQKEDPSIVEWVLAGQAFFIRDRDRFIGEILAKYFRHCKTIDPVHFIPSVVPTVGTHQFYLIQFTSFQRQLNIYNFQRITKGSYSGAYYHPLFIRDDPLLSMQLKRSLKKLDCEQPSKCVIRKMPQSRIDPNHCDDYSTKK
ncbi:hypothetical protein ACHAXS_005249 [Conticribra weissflogii]